MRMGVFGAALAAAAVFTGGASAQSVEGFYKGKTISVISYSGASSAYTVYARVLSQHMPRHLPGKPTMIVKSMTGAGGLTATRFLYGAAPKDGTTIGTISRGIPFEPLFGGTKVEFDALKFVWIGSMSRETTMFVSWHTAKVKTGKDLFDKELLLAGTGAGADSEVISRALNGLLGTKIKIIGGYTGASVAALAMERGEIEGIYWTWNGINTSRPDWIRDKKLNLLFQTRATPHPELPQVPVVDSLAKNDDQRRALRLMFARDVLGRPFLAPPEIPADRAAALRAGFDASVKDPALLADAAKGKMEIDLVTGAEVEKLIADAYATDPRVIDMVKRAMGR